MTHDQKISTSKPFALLTWGLRPRLRDAKNNPPSDSSALLAFSGEVFLCAFLNSVNLLVCLTTSACIAKPVHGAMGSIRRGMRTGTRPTLMFSVKMLSNGLSSAPVGVPPDGSALRNGLPMLRSAKRNELP